MPGPVFTVSGLPGSGKTTVAKGLCKELGLEYISPAVFYNRKDCVKKGNVVVDHTYAALLCHVDDIDAFHIFLHAPLETRAQRMKEKNSKDVREIMDNLARREEAEVKVGKDLYKMDYRCPQFYNIMKDTRKMKPETVVALILRRHRVHYNIPDIAEVVVE